MVKASFASLEASLDDGEAILSCRHGNATTVLVRGDTLVIRYWYSEVVSGRWRIDPEAGISLTLAEFGTLLFILKKRGLP